MQQEMEQFVTIRILLWDRENTNISSTNVFTEQKIVYHKTSPRSLDLSAPQTRINLSIAALKPFYTAGSFKYTEANI